MRKRASPTIRASRNSGFQSGSVSVSYFKRLSDIPSDREALLSAPLPLVSFGNDQKSGAPPRAPPPGLDSVHPTWARPGRPL